MEAKPMARTDWLALLEELVALLQKLFGGETAQLREKVRDCEGANVDKIDEILRCHLYCAAMLLDLRAALGDDGGDGGDGGDGKSGADGVQGATGQVGPPGVPSAEAMGGKGGAGGAAPAPQRRRQAPPAK